MITPQLIALHSPDLDVGSIPSDPANCQILITATIGPSGTGGGENFDFLVATPRSLQHRGEIRWGRGVLVMNEFSWETTQRMLQRLLAQVSRPTWPEVAAELNKELLWEFDNYQEHTQDRSAV